jgi:hypothetical protein
LPHEYFLPNSDTAVTFTRPSLLGAVRLEPTGITISTGSVATRFPGARHEHRTQEVTNVQVRRRKIIFVESIRALYRFACLA